jgi:hypothetical protein
VSEPLQAEQAEASAEPPRASVLQVMRAVMWSFIGIRKGSGYEDDVAKIRPLQAIVAGLIGAAIFVGCLVTLVRFLTAK